MNFGTAYYLLQVTHVNDCVVAFEIVSFLYGMAPTRGLEQLSSGRSRFREATELCDEAIQVVGHERVVNRIHLSWLLFYSNQI